MQTLTSCDAKITSTRTAVGQFKGQFNGAMEDMSGQGQKASTPITHVRDTRWYWSALPCGDDESPPPCKPKSRARNDSIGAMER